MARSRDGPETGSPKKATWPTDGMTSPASIRSNVVLPHPEGPMMQTKRFSAMSKEMSRRMTRAWSPEP
jgi:hypothetical protein